MLTLKIRLVLSMRCIWLYYRKCVCFRTARFCIRPSGWKNMAHSRLFSSSAKSGICRLRICICPVSCRRRVRCEGRGRSGICCHLSRSCRSRVCGRLPWGVRAWRFAFWWSVRKGSWSRICSFPYRNGCRGSFSVQHGTSRTWLVRSALVRPCICSLQSTGQHKDFWCLLVRFLVSHISRTLCCTCVQL